MKSVRRWTNWPTYTESVQKAVHRVFRNNRFAISGYWTGVSSFERKFAEAFAGFNECRYCVPTTNGSSALVIALEALDIGCGDEVLVPALTWVATATAVLNVNATPILVDVEPTTYCLDPIKIEAAITSRTKAIIVVHLYGNMANMDAILRIAARYKLKIIEDSAQAHGSAWRGRYAGTSGNIGTFSFQQGKILSSGEGGATITNSRVIYRRLEQLRSDSRCRYENEAMIYGDMDLAPKGVMHGTNYCLSELQSAILTAELPSVRKLDAIRHEGAEYLNSELPKVSGIQCVMQYPQVTHRAYYGYPIKLDISHFGNISVQKICDLMRMELRLGTFYLHPAYPPIHKNMLFCPWTKRRFHKNISQNKDYWQSLCLPVSERAMHELLVLHHSILLEPRAKLQKIVRFFAKLSRA